MFNTLKIWSNFCAFHIYNTYDEKLVDTSYNCENTNKKKIQKEFVVNLKNFI